MEIIFQFKNQWHQLFEEYNWYTFDIIQLSIENDMKMTGGWTVDFYLLGLGFYLRVNFNFEESEVGKTYEENK